MANHRNGNDFTSGTRAVLGKRVGYKCSRCHKSTLSLHSNPEKVIDIGEGAHICAASPGGPRYDENMTSDQIKSAANGIFLCRECHAIIDRDPITYPVEKLKKMKEDAENSANFPYVLTKYDHNQQKALRRYYDSAIQTFEEKRNDFISDESLAESYIMPMIGDKSLLDLVWEWYEDTDYGIMLLYGQPGHGKTTICQKAVYDYAKHTDHAAEEALVLQFPLNQAKSNLIDDFDKGTIKLENVFHRPGRDVPYIELDDCEGKLIFLDGYDEVKYLLAEHTRYEFLQDFIGTESSSDDRLMSLAKEYGIHFVITSRVNALTEADIASAKSIEFPKLDTWQQEQWCVRRPDYKMRWDDSLEAICTSTEEKGTIKDLNQLLQIPYIFRMVVHNDYQISEEVSNKAALFKDLFSKTVERNALYIKKDLKNPVPPEELSVGYQNLAYKIWCDNEDSAKDIKNSDILLLAYYIKEDTNQGRYSFIHKSFYDYYMALFLYEQMKKCSNANEVVCEEFLSKLAERRIDTDILKLFEEMIQNSAETESLLLGIKAILLSLDSNEAVGLDKKTIAEIMGTAEKSRFDRCNHILVNTINLAVLTGEKELKKYERVIRLLSKYSCNNALLRNVDLSMANLSRANLSGCDLRGANLNNAILKGADLRFADLSNAKLKESNLEEACLQDTIFYMANLMGASLSGANLKKADLTGTTLNDAKLKGTYLGFTILDGATLNGAVLIRTPLYTTKIKKAILRGAHISIMQKKHLMFQTGADIQGVVWCDDATGKPIE